MKLVRRCEMRELPSNIKDAIRQGTKRGRPIKLNKSLMRESMNYPRGKQRDEFLDTFFIFRSTIKDCQMSIIVRFK
ncbi:hypothetical protein [Vibrio sp. SCSIO 43136]|uniref:hypothetical protein n=1 Tax=Vibrio sp. SCSIO 43136 TaxID=2819101 RepID=UPI0020762D0D|nr:hypothetical protein [Vibrio sp. SCSIO 43136]USD68098.1 hypothetical protein J4N39_18155 [Vibrio sp. SCSIO 43136]